MDIIDDLIPPVHGIRTGNKLTKCLGLVVHWIGVAQPSANVIRANFAREMCGTHYICDYNDGHIIRCVPENEVCYHVGSMHYTSLKLQLLGDENPNRYFVGIECCISPKDVPPADYAATGKYMDLGKPSEVQYAALVEFAADFLIRHGMTVKNLYRHYDITGKMCHIWFAKDHTRWENFRKDVELNMKQITQKQFCTMYHTMQNEINTQPVQKYAQKSWEKACNKKIFEDRMPAASITREQVAVILDRLGLLEQEGTRNGPQ